MVGMTCEGSILGLKHPFSEKSKAIPASQLNKTSFRTSLSAGVISSPIFSFSNRSGVNLCPLTMSEDLGMKHGYFGFTLLLFLFTTICSFKFSIPSCLRPCLCGLFTGLTLSFFFLYKVSILPYELTEKPSLLVPGCSGSGHIPLVASGHVGSYDISLIDP